MQGCWSGSGSHLLNPHAAQEFAREWDWGPLRPHIPIQRILPHDNDKLDASHSHHFSLYPTPQEWTANLSSSPRT